MCHDGHRLRRIGTIGRFASGSDYGVADTSWAGRSRAFL
jgi:hypothetical protein